MISRTRMLGVTAVALGLALVGTSPRAEAQAVGLGGFGNNNGFGGQDGFVGGFGNNNQNGFGNQNGFAGGFGNNNGFGGGFLYAVPGQVGGGGGVFGVPSYVPNVYNDAFAINRPQTYNNLGGLSAAIGGAVNGRQGAVGGMPLRRRRR